MTKLYKVKAHRNQKNQSYLDSGGVYCLHCGSEDLTTGTMETDAGIAYQNVTCDDCGESWVDEYTLTSVRKV